MSIEGNRDGEGGGVAILPQRLDVYVHLPDVAPAPGTPGEALADGLLRLLARALAPYIPPRKPGAFTLSVTAQGETAMIVTATLPAKTASDVATFELTYTVDGAAPLVLTSTGDPITFNAPAGAKVSAAFVEIDGSGNRSPASDPVELVIVDNVAPGKPGTFGLAVTAQE